MNRSVQNFKVISFLCVFILLLLTLTITSPPVRTRVKSEQLNNGDIDSDPRSRLQYTWVNEPMVILNDSTLAYYASSGVGSTNSPYIIEDYHFGINSVIQLHIENTAACFVVQNCDFSAYYPYSEKVGIKINNVPNGTASIKFNEFSSLGYAIKADNASGISIQDNYFSQPYTGIYLSRCNNSMVTGNEFGYSIDYSIRISQSDNSIIQENLCRNWYASGIVVETSDFVEISHNNCSDSSEDGIKVTSSYYPYIHSNRLIGNLQGLYVQSCPNAILHSNFFANNSNTGLKLADNTAVPSEDLYIDNNIFLNDGLKIEEDTVQQYLNYEIKESNLINGRQFGLFVNISNSLIDAQAYGQVIVAFCTNLSIVNANISHTRVGVTFSYSTDCTLNSSHLSDNKMAVVLHNSEHSTLAKNVITVNSYGLHLYMAQHNSIVNNSFIDNSIGVKIYVASYSHITNNNFIHCGLLLDTPGTDLIIENNTINGLELGYFSNEANMTFDTPGVYGQILFYSCTNVSIRGLEFSTIDTALFFKSTPNVTIDSCSFYHSGKAVTLLSCYPVTLTNNIFYNNSKGIYGDWAQNINMVSNNFTYNRYGVYLDSSRDKGNNITNNIFHANDQGFYVRNGDLFRIIDNSFINSTSKALFIDFASERFLIQGNNFTLNGDESLSLYKADSCFVTQNYVYENEDRGFAAQDVNDNVFTQNRFLGNRYAGLSISGSNNYVYNNTFVENGFQASDNSYHQAQCYDDTNYFYNETLQLGNCWSDYDGSGSYEIFSSGVDLYPRITLGPPRILGYIPEDMVFREDQAWNKEFDWQIIDDNPDIYQVFLNGILLNQADWESGEIITFSLVNTPPGMYNYTLVAYDEDNQLLLDEVIIEIEPLEKYAPQPVCLSTEFTFTEGIAKKEFSLIWNVSDLDNNPEDYGVVINDSFYEYGTWSVGELVEIFVGDLSAGTHNLTIIFDDASGLKGTDSVLLFVLPNQTLSSASVVYSSSYPSSASTPVKTPLEFLSLLTGLLFMVVQGNKGKERKG